MPSSIRASNSSISLKRGQEDLEAIFDSQVYPRTWHTTICSEHTRGQGAVKVQASQKAIYQIFQSLPSPTRCLKMRKESIGYKTI